jgi:hypothetical protein
MIRTLVIINHQISVPIRNCAGNFSFLEWLELYFVTCKVSSYSIVPAFTLKYDLYCKNKSLIIDSESKSNSNHYTG